MTIYQILTCLFSAFYRFFCLLPSIFLNLHFPVALAVWEWHSDKLFLAILTLNLLQHDRRSAPVLMVFPAWGVVVIGGYLFHFSYCFVVSVGIRLFQSVYFVKTGFRRLHTL